MTAHAGTADGFLGDQPVDVKTTKRWNGPPPPKHHDVKMVGKLRVGVMLRSENMGFSIEDGMEILGGKTTPEMLYTVSTVLHHEKILPSLVCTRLTESGTVDMREFMTNALAIAAYRRLLEQRGQVHRQAVRWYRPGWWQLGRAIAWVAGKLSK